MAYQVPLGDNFWVFSSVQAPMRRWSTRENCIIDCHGRKAILKPDFTVPTGVNIRFYVTDGAFLAISEDASADGTYHYVDAVDDIANRRVKAVEHKLSGSNCPNYVLSKQHKSGKRQAPFRYDDVGYGDLLAYLDANPGIAARYDLVTVRNRAFSGDPTLYDFVRTCTRDGFCYTNIRCSFCRGGFGDMVKLLVGKGRSETAGEMAP
jgi:hypothetical protein